ncbi:hypothetical protein ACQEU8_19835 [Streptomyces sp. CA-250714]|uniref:hypothetical protein n=1 Tax=Streptomyces sp. CA-250714 TaxID=3240060 RepID=UPI003D948301
MNEQMQAGTYGVDASVSMTRPRSVTVGVWLSSAYWAFIVVCGIVKADAGELGKQIAGLLAVGVVAALFLRAVWQGGHPRVHAFLTQLMGIIGLGAGGMLVLTVFMSDNDQYGDAGWWGNVAMIGVSCGSLLVAAWQLNRPQARIWCAERSAPMRA